VSTRLAADSSSDRAWGELFEIRDTYMPRGEEASILEFDQTAAGNPQAVLDIIRGAHAQGTRNLSIGSANSEFVRVTGYLVRRADLDAKAQEKASRYSSAALASGFMQTKPNHLHRRTRTV
jgi:hypothetical protein